MYTSMYVYKSTPLLPNPWLLFVCFFETVFHVVQTDLSYCASEASLELLILLLPTSRAMLLLPS